ncbi:MAG: Rieske (2Fe-2S) protein [Rhodospirillales bacterium]|nr:Rieske (2Fe-2S) protein [Rhodospirillales bacterium]
MNRIEIARYDALADRKPHYALVGEVDLVAVRFDDAVSVFYGRCLHRGALMADGFVRGNNLMCGLHYWDYRLDSGVSEYNNAEALPKFRSWIEDGAILVDEDEIAAWAKENPQPYNRKTYLGLYADSGQGATPAKARPRPAITARSTPWACRAASCQIGTTSKSSRPSCTARPC